jgi:hypothetical protein
MTDAKQPVDQPTETPSPIAVGGISNAAKMRSVVSAVVILAGVVFVALKSLPAYNETLRPEYDELAYLDLANGGAEAGGWLTFLPRCLSGEYREANRHPLYLLTLATFAERDPRFYPRAKLASWLIGLAATGILLLVVTRIAGPPGAVLVALLLGHNDLWLGMSYSVAVEMLLFALLASAWYCICFHPASLRAQTAAGTCLGLAFLTKATTLIVVLAYLLAQIWTNRIRVIRDRTTWVLLAAWLVVASPLLIRNVRVYGSPFFNVNSKYMWLDDWSEVKLADEDVIATQSAWRFVERNGAGTLLIRVFGGLLREASYLLTALSLFHDRVSIKAVLVGLVPLVIGLIGIRRLPNPLARAFTSLTVVGFLAALALHTPHASHPRFQLTLVPLLYATLSLEVISWLTALSHGRSAPRDSSASSAQKPEAQAREPGETSSLALRVSMPDKFSWIAIGVGAAIAAVSLAVGQSWARTWPPHMLQAHSLAEHELAMADWMADHLSPEDAVVLAGTDFSPYWYRKISGRVYEYPANPDVVTFENWSARRIVTCVVFDARRVPRWAADWQEMAHEPQPSAASERWVLKFESHSLRFYRRAVTRASRDLPPAQTP